MKFYRDTNCRGYWILPLLAYDFNERKIRFWFAWIKYCYCLDFNK